MNVRKMLYGTNKEKTKEFIRWIVNKNLNFRSEKLYYESPYIPPYSFENKKKDIWILIYPNMHKEANLIEVQTSKDVALIEVYNDKIRANINLKGWEEYEDIIFEDSGIRFVKKNKELLNKKIKIK